MKVKAGKFGNYSYSIVDDSGLGEYDITIKCNWDNYSKNLSMKSRDIGIVEYFVFRKIAEMNYRKGKVA